MNKTNTKVPTRTGTSKLVRARFGPGMLLQHEDLELLNTYTRDLSRLMFRSFFGCGVMCGLVVTTDKKCGSITVGAGVALSCSGDPIWLPKAETFQRDEDCDSDPPKELWVELCGTVTNCGPRTAVCSADDDESSSEWTRERDGYRIRLLSTRPSGCVCGCPDPLSDNEIRIGDDTACKCVNPSLPEPVPQPPVPQPPYVRCYEKHYNGECECSCDACSDCDCNCVLLAKLKWIEQTNEWSVDHRVRRFVRPILMRDPQVAQEERDRKAALQTKPGQTAETLAHKQTAARAIDDAMTDIAEEVVRKELKLANNKDVVERLRSIVREELQRKINPEVVVRDVIQEEREKELLAAVRDEAQNAKLAANREAEIEEYREKLKALEAAEPADAAAVIDAEAPAASEQPGQPAGSKTETKKKQSNKKQSGGGTQ